MKRILFYLSIFSIMMVTSCEIVEDPDIFEPDQPDASGNLLIINNSNQQLVLYKDQVVIKKIPASATDFLIEVPTTQDEPTVQLDLYLWTDVFDNIDNPDPTLAYKRWLVPLSYSSDVENRVTWHVDGIEQYTDVATLNLAYYGGTENNVDVFVNGLVGGKITSLKPGDQYKRVGIDYGNYTLSYQYWFSDQNDNIAKTEIGTIDKQLVNGSEKDIWLILNENRNDVSIIVPHYGTSIGDITKYAGLTIKNQYPEGLPVRIYLGDKLIESVCYLEDGSVTNLSTIDYLGEYTYYIPITEEGVDEKSISLVAKSLTTGNDIDKELNFTITADSTVTWTVDGIIE